MSNIGWNGPDPVVDAFPTPQELGTEFIANVDVTITHARVWTDVTELPRTNRRARIWSTAGAQLGIATLPDDLPTGWSTWPLDTPVPRTAGQRWVTSFTTGGNEGFASHALDFDVVSVDGAVTALAHNNATSGNGVFTLTPATFPTTQGGGNSFFGADVLYDLGIGGNTAPRLTLTASTTDLSTTVTAVVADDETLVGATLRFIWGDGNPDTLVSYPTVSASHTFATERDYAVAVVLTDAGGLTDTAAVVATAREPITGGVIEAAQDALTDALRAALPGQYRVIQFGKEAQPPSLSIAPPTLRWESTCYGDPTSATFAVCVIERQDQLAFERLRLVIPRVADAIDNVRNASVINAAPTIYPGSAVELPCYVFTVEVGL